jgi:hypothetical protein
MWRGFSRISGIVAAVFARSKDADGGQVRVVGEDGDGDGDG